MSQTPAPVSAPGPAPVRPPPTGSPPVPPGTSTFDIAPPVPRGATSGRMSPRATVPAGATLRFRYLGENGHWFDDPDADYIDHEGSVVLVRA